MVDEKVSGEMEKEMSSEIDKAISEPSEFTCEVCGFIAKSKAGLAKHQTTHEK